MKMILVEIVSMVVIVDLLLKVGILSLYISG